MSLKGIITPLATPLNSFGTAIDCNSTRRLINHVIKGGVSGIFILGSTGEGPSLSPTLRREFISLCCEIIDLYHNNGTIQILVGVSDTCVSETIALAEHASSCGAHAIVITAPYYFPISQAELKNYVDHIVKHTTLPIFLYNMPALTKVTFEIDTVRELATKYGGSNGRILGIKDSSFDLNYMSQLCQIKKNDVPSWLILTGAEHHVAQVVTMGGDGGVLGGSNIIPEAFVSFYKGAVLGNKEMEDEAHQTIQTLKILYDMANGRFVQATKTSLCVLGICEESFAMPLLPFNEEEQTLVQKAVSDLKICVPEAPPMKHVDDQ